MYKKRLDDIVVQESRIETNIERKVRSRVKEEDVYNFTMSRLFLYYERRW